MHLTKSITWIFAGTCSATSLPTVDLGYQVHQAIIFNESSRLYKFSNIRYALPPVGDLRWALPVAPAGVNKRVQNGSVDLICPQGFPEWSTVTGIFQNNYTAKTPDLFNHDTAVVQAKALYPNGTGEKYSMMPGTSEDCLVLDVHVPETVFKTGSKAKAPVMVWIHGGAYVTGNKVDGSAGDPTGIITTSQKDGSAGIIHVSMNYRLGSLGFMSGKSYQEEGGIANLGLRDQRLALEWVKKYIRLFGGDPKKVTVAGGSAGAGSIVYHLLSNDGDLPFQQSWSQSPGLVPASNATKDKTSLLFLEKLGVKSFTEARLLPSERIIRANADLISEAATSQFFFAPVEDGSCIPDTAAVRLRNGDIHKGIKQMISYTNNEGFTFFPTNAVTDEAFGEYLRLMFPAISESTVSYIVDELYPLSEFGGLWYERAAAFVGDYGLKCPANALTKAYRNQTFNYEWDVFPGYHGYDFLHAFYSGNQWGGVVNMTYAEMLQSYITDFVKTGDPNHSGLMNWPKEGRKSKIMSFQEQGPVVETDPTANARCQSLQSLDLLV